ncbi:MAG: hypothetical protein Q4C82_04915, partial [Eubacteriales bacterium]|nr:hypothetical protein [Eubacteriales bacterium]
MEFDVKSLEEKLNCYFKGDISKEDLGAWAKKAYYDILRGGYVEIKKIVMYPFLKTISTFHVKESDKEDVFPCSEDDVKKIRDILNGVIEFEFDVELSIPSQVYNMFKGRHYYDEEKRETFAKLRNEMMQCFEQSGKILSLTVINVQSGLNPLIL